MKIQFQAFDKDIEILFEKPRPAVQVIPEWYKNMPTRMDEENIDGLSKNTTAVSNLTLKGCSPFLDALSTGYIFELPFDIEFRKSNGMINVRWATNIDLIGQHGLDQAPGLPSSFNGSSGLLKWKPGWRVITPKGYSCLFTHPINRHDLPFRTFSGVVDTDIYSLGVELPFQLLDSKIDKDIFILERGTPICQILPFKREDWQSQTIPFDEDANRKNLFLLKSKIVRSYKQQFWQKKSYI